VLAGGALVFEEKCVRGIEANRERIADTVERSLMLATPLAPIIGYDRAAEVAKKAFATNKTVRQIALETLDLTPEQLDKVLDVSSMTVPGASGGGE
jgi:fumarate hydratase class II